MHHWIWLGVGTDFFISLIIFTLFLESTLIVNRLVSQRLNKNQSYIKVSVCRRQQRCFSFWVKLLGRNVPKLTQIDDRGKICIIKPLIFCFTFQLKMQMSLLKFSSDFSMIYFLVQIKVDWSSNLLDSKCMYSSTCMCSGHLDLGFCRH